jgi:adenylylsulfate kinase-like enzyme
MTRTPGGVLLISGVPASGKTTVAKLVAALLPRSGLIHGDDIHNLVISGRQHPDGSPPEEVDLQMVLRDRNISVLADNLAEAGFLPVIDDVVVYMPRLERLLAGIRTRPLFIAMLAPDLDAIQQRDRDRPDKHVFNIWSHLDALMRREMSGFGCWIDSTRLTPHQTAAAVMERVWSEGLVADL